MELLRGDILAYDETFTLDDGVTTITWSARPPSIKGGGRGQYVEHPIPGARHSVIQHTGANSEKWRFSWIQYNSNLVSSTGIVSPRDVVEVLDGWNKDGSLLTFMCDWIISALGEATGIDCLLTGFMWDEIPGTEESYRVEIEITRYYGANP